MNGFEILASLFITRLIVPAAILILIGEWMKRRNIHSRNS
jgi:hypothetical protein